MKKNWFFPLLAVITAVVGAVVALSLFMKKRYHGQQEYLHFFNDEFEDELIEDEDALFYEPEESAAEIDAEPAAPDKTAQDGFNEAGITDEEIELDQLEADILADQPEDGVDGVETV